MRAQKHASDVLARQLSLDTHSMLIPFLYQTKSIRRHLRFLTASALRRSSDDQTTYRPAVSDREGLRATPSQQPRKVRGEYVRDSSKPLQRSHDSARHRRRAPGAYDEDRSRLPFERRTSAPAAKVFDQLKEHSPNPQSTLTHHEYKAFQSLLALQQKFDKSLPPEQWQEREQKGAALNAVLEKEIGVKIAPFETIDTDDRATALSRQSMSLPAQRELNRVRSLLQDAKTDARAWEILSEEVLRPVQELDLSSSLFSVDRATILQGLGDVTPTSDASAREEEWNEASRMEHDNILAQAFPEHLVNFQTILGQNFPSSLYNIYLLPWLQAQGDALFTLGASTELYNRHLRQLFKKHYDIAAMIEALQDMHQRVYDFDRTTLEIVVRVLEDVDDAVQTNPPNGLSVLWSSEHMRDLRTALRVWQRRIEEQINEKALQMAREREERALDRQVTHDDAVGMD